jgi:hypothetical protein
VSTQCFIKTEHFVFFSFFSSFFLVLLFGEDVPVMAYEKSPRAAKSGSGLAWPVPSVFRWKRFETFKLPKLLKLYLFYISQLFYFLRAPLWGKSASNGCQMAVEKPSRAARSGSGQPRWDARVPWNIRGSMRALWDLQCRGLTVFFRPREEKTRPTSFRAVI